MRAASALAAIAALALPAPATAHQAGLSHGHLSLRGDRVEASLLMAWSELLAAEPPLVPEQAEGDAGALARAALSALELARGGEPCALEEARGAAEPPDGLAASGTFRCPAAGALEVRVALVERLPRGHTHLARVETDGAVEERVVRAGAAGYRVASPEGSLEQALRFVALGVEHIFTGPDHLAFLFGLLLAARALRDLARVVTGFTVAHSLTLALAATGLVTPPPRLIEPLIAASIVFVSVENLLASRRRALPDAPFRQRRVWPIAFAFGLVHGFGFASALGPLHLSARQLAASLLAFNVGVEAGQLGFVLALLPLLRLASRGARAGLLTLRLGSLGVGAAGACWLVERLS